MVGKGPVTLTPRRTAWIGACALVAAVVVGSAVRIHSALSLPGLASNAVEGMLKSDPALLYYVTQRIIESGGLPPDDFRADPRVEHPETSDLPAMFTVGQEFLVAWAFLAFGADTPLHVISVIVMGILASLAAVGVYGLTRELTGSDGWAGFAVAFFAVLAANYRTVGFVFLREDLSLPLFSLHVWLLARSVRTRSPASIGLAAAALAMALATWHAMGFIVAIEALCVFLWYLRTGRNPLAAPAAWLFPAVLVAGILVVPVLRAKLVLFSLPVQIVFALLLAARFASRAGRDSSSGRWVGGLALALLVGLVAALSGSLADGGRDYAHVLEYLSANLRFHGTMPDDPSALSFGARLLWQGPFAPGSISRLASELFLAGLLLPLALFRSAPAWLRGRGDGRIAVLMAFVFASLVAAFFVKRMVVLPGLVAPVACALLLSSMRRFAPAFATTLLALQPVVFFAIMGDLEKRTRSWYDPEEREGIAAVVAWIGQNVAPDEAIAAEFVSSTAVLAHTRNPVLLQPKYETRRSRDRIELFVTALYRDTPREFAQLLRDEFDCRVLLVDAVRLWALRYAAGLPLSVRAPPVESAAYALLNPSPSVYREVPGFRLLYAGPREPHRWRIYRSE